jgi:hypothetical protein
METIKSEKDTDFIYNIRDKNSARYCASTKRAASAEITGFLLNPHC